MYLITGEMRQLFVYSFVVYHIPLNLSSSP